MQCHRLRALISTGYLVSVISGPMAGLAEVGLRPALLMMMGIFYTIIVFIMGPIQIAIDFFDVPLTDHRANRRAKWRLGIGFWMTFFLCGCVAAGLSQTHADVCIKWTVLVITLLLLRWVVRRQTRIIEFDGDTSDAHRGAVDTGA